MTGPVFAVGDVHGQLGQLERVLELIAADPSGGAPVVFLGDYVDRGPDSRGVIERLRSGQAAGAPWTCLAGNHDLYFRDFLSGEGMSDGAARAWLGPALGGDATLASYGVELRAPLAEMRAAARAAVPLEHRHWLEGLPFVHETDAQVFVHAGVRPGVPLGEQDPWELVTIRDLFLDDPRDHGRLVVHGHTAAEGVRHAGNRVNLDGGAGFGRPLRAALIEGREVWLLSEAGRVPLAPGERTVR